MTGQDDVHLKRSRFLAHVVQRECRRLLTADSRLFAEPFKQARRKALAVDIELMERVEVSAAPLGRLQDTLCEKLIPAMPRALGEPVGVAIDNLDRAERLGWLPSSEQWLVVRRLRNQMAHDYIKDMAILASAPQAAHAQAPMLAEASLVLLEEIDRRGWPSL